MRGGNPQCAGGTGVCMATDDVVEIGCNGPWIAASGFSFEFDDDDSTSDD